MNGWIIIKLDVSLVNRFFFIVRGAGGDVLGTSRSGLQLLEQPLSDGISTLSVLGIVIVGSLLLYLLYRYARLKREWAAFPFLNLIWLIGQGLARSFNRQLIRIVERHSAEIERALGRAQERLGSQGTRTSGPV